MKSLFPGVDKEKFDVSYLADIIPVSSPNRVSSKVEGRSQWQLES